MIHIVAWLAAVTGLFGVTVGTWEAVTWLKRRFRR